MSFTPLCHARISSQIQQNRQNLIGKALGSGTVKRQNFTVDATHSVTHPADGATAANPPPAKLPDISSRVSPTLHGQLQTGQLRPCPCCEAVNDTPERLIIL
ncbi:hypothetical protein GCM10010841_29130 [Deinococcus aerophilus]|uniref:Uncharacterized protein n=1 Tax=Deinococcus aerophilus TaxID=522488 RepID=A0ABQ2GZ00_9DEIO|nr:hypothetical protein GCM10010841_29130 [Deinococcus aerophilus]